MDVVRNEVTAFRRSRRANTVVTGVRTTFALSVPLTLAVTQVLLVGVGKAVFVSRRPSLIQVRRFRRVSASAAAVPVSCNMPARRLPPVAR